MATLKLIPLSSPEPSRIDRCGYLIAREQEAKPWLKELAALKTELREYAKTRPADQPVRLVGADYYLDLTARELEREVTDKPKAFAALRKAMGIVKLIASLKITFTLLDAQIPVENQTAYTTSARTGSRDVTGGLLMAPEVRAVA